MKKYILDGIFMLMVFAGLYFMLIIGSTYEKHIRCERGYNPACEILSLHQ